MSTKFDTANQQYFASVDVVQRYPRSGAPTTAHELVLRGCNERLGLDLSKIPSDYMFLAPDRWFERSVYERIGCDVVMVYLSWSEFTELASNSLRPQDRFAAGLGGQAFGGRNLRFRNGQRDSLECRRVSAAIYSAGHKVAGWYGLTRPT